MIILKVGNLIPHDRRLSICVTAEIVRIDKEWLKQLLIIPKFLTFEQKNLIGTLNDFEPDLDLLLETMIYIYFIRLTRRRFHHVTYIYFSSSDLYKKNRRSAQVPCRCERKINTWFTEENDHYCFEPCKIFMR